MYAQDSIDMLAHAGIQFKKHEDEGVDINEFAELLTSSGLVLCDDVTWITFARWGGKETVLVVHVIYFTFLFLYFIYLIFYMFNILYI